MENDESIKDMFFWFINIVNKSLGKIYPVIDFVDKFLDHFPNVKPKMTTIYEAKGLKTLQHDRLFGSLISHDMVLGGDASKKKKRIALKATMESEGELDNE